MEDKKTYTQNENKTKRQPENVVLPKKYSERKDRIFLYSETDKNNGDSIM